MEMCVPASNRNDRQQGPEALEFVPQCIGNNGPQFRGNRERGLFLVFAAGAVQARIEAGFGWIPVIAFNVVAMVACTESSRIARKPGAVGGEDHVMPAQFGVLRQRAAST